MSDTAFRMVQHALRVEFVGTGLCTDAQIDELALRVVRDYEAPKGLTVHARLNWRVDLAKWLRAHEAAEEAGPMNAGELCQRCDQPAVWTWPGPNRTVYLCATHKEELRAAMQLLVDLAANEVLSETERIVREAATWEEAGR